MPTALLLRLYLLVAIGNIAVAKDLSVVDEFYMIGLRDLYSVGHNYIKTEKVPFAVMALDFAGYANVGGFAPPVQSDQFIMNRGELWPCKGNFSWIINADTNVIGAQDFNKEGLLTYSKLLEKYGTLLEMRPQQTYAHVFFSHLPSPVTINAFVQIAERSTTKFTLGYFQDAPLIDGKNMNEQLHKMAVDLTKDVQNLAFGRITGKNTSTEGLMRPPLRGCNLFVPLRKRVGFPEPQIRLAKRRIKVLHNMFGGQTMILKAEYRFKWFVGGKADYYCKKGMGTQPATVEQMQQSAEAGYAYPCSWLVDGTAREVVEDPDCPDKLIVRKCRIRGTDEANFACSVTASSVAYVAARENGNADKMSEGNEMCLRNFKSYLASKEQLLQAMSIGFAGVKRHQDCALTTDGRAYTFDRVGKNHTSLQLRECFPSTLPGFYCSTEKPDVFRYPYAGEKLPTLNDAIEGCNSVNAHLATEGQLREAQRRGMDYCDCGWLSEGQVRYPINFPRQGCGETQAPGLRACPGLPSKWNREGWAAYCSRVELPIIIQQDDYSTWDEAMESCKVRGRGMATYDMMLRAHSLGFRSHRCIILANGNSYQIIDTIRECAYPTKFHYSRFKLPVFYVNNTEVRYHFANPAAANEACKARGSVIASEELLSLAFELGYDQCSCGWLAGGAAKFVISRPRKGCGETDGPGFRDCPPPRAWNQVGWDTYCVAVDDAE